MNHVHKSSLSVSQRVQYLHIAKDSYTEYSLKESERIRRKNDTEGLEIFGMTLDTPVPHIPDKFWASENNKRNIQQLCRDLVKGQMDLYQNTIISSVVSHGECVPAIYARAEEIPALTNCIEETDTKLIVHVSWAIRTKKCTRVIVLLNDTDTFALLLHYIPCFLEQGRKELHINMLKLKVIIRNCYDMIFDK